MNLSLNLGKFSFQIGTRNSQRPTPPLSTRSGALSPSQAWLRGDDSCATPLLISPYQQSVWVYTAVSALAQTVSAIPFRISRGDRSGENLLTQGPVIDLFNRPHPAMNRFRFWELIVTWYYLRGEAFIVALDSSDTVLPIKGAPAYASKPSNGSTVQRIHSLTNPRFNDGTIKHLLVLNPDDFRHRVENSELIGWKFTGSPTAGPLPSMDLLPEEVLHDFLPNPHLFWRGMSPLSVALLAA